MQNSNQGSTTIGGYIQPIQRTHLEHLVKVTRKIVALGPTAHLLYKATLLRPGDIAT